MLTALFSASMIWLVAVVTPGPNFLATIGVAVSQSRSAALWTVLGIVCGTVLWGLAGFFGITVLFRAAPWLYLALKIGGGSYLIYLGVCSIRSHGVSAAGTPHGRAVAHSPLAIWRFGLVTNMTNPKTALFVASLFSATMPADAGVELGLCVVSMMTVMTLLWYGVVACFFAGVRVQRLYRRTRGWIDRIAGAMFIVFGVRLIAAR